MGNELGGLFVYAEDGLRFVKSYFFDGENAVEGIDMDRRGTLYVSM